MGAATSARSRAALGDRAIDAAVGAFAGWTLACHAAAFAGGSLRDVLWIAAAIAGAAGLAVAIARRRGARDETRISPARADLPESGAVSWRLALAGLSAGALPLAVHASGGSPTAVWWTALAALGAGLLFGWRDGEGNAAAPRRHRIWSAALFACVIAGALLPLLFPRMDIDDAYYVNVAAAIADQPERAILAGDTLFGDPGLPLLLPVYRLHSFEVLAAAIARYLPFEPIEASHWVLAGLFGACLPLAWARLARVATPRDWIATTLAAVAVLALVGETHRFGANFAFLRLHQGKAVLVGVLVPVVLAHGLEYGARGGGRAWARLAASQVAAVGASATALWLAPLVAGSAVLAGARRGALPRRLAGAAASSGYLVVAALVLRRATAEALGGFEEAPAAAAFADASALLAATWESVVGTGPVAAFSALALVGGFAFAPSGPARRVALVFPLVFLVLLFDPYLARFVAAEITGELTWFRVFWFLPLPLFLALLLTAPLRVSRLGARLAPWRGWASAALVLAFVGPFTRTHALTADNKVRFAPFALKVNPIAYEAAQALAEAVPARSRVHAPKDVAPWVGTFRGFPHALVPRPMYLDFLVPLRPADELAERRFLDAAWSDPGLTKDPEGLRRYGQALERFDVRAVCVPPSARHLEPALEAAGFRPVSRIGSYGLWSR